VGLLIVLAATTCADARTAEAFIFVPKASDVVSQGAPRPSRPIDTSGVPALSTPQAQRALTPFLGKNIDKGLLDAVRDTVSAYFAGIKQPYVTVVFPQQDVTNGVLQAVVTQSRLGTVSVMGNNWFDASLYRNAIQARPGTLIDNDALSTDMDWINSNQYRHAVVQAAAGKAPGTTDLMIRAQDRFPVSLNAGIDNTGNASTGLTRLTTGFDWGNAFFRGDDLNYEYETTPNGSTLQQHTASYAFNFPTRSTLSVSGEYATTQVPSAAFNNTGLTETLSVRYTAPLPSKGNFSQQIAGGTDYKSTNNNLLFGGVSVFPTTTKIYDFAVSYSPALSDHLGNTSATFSAFLSPGGWGNANTTVAFSTQQPGAVARYTYGNASVVRAFNFKGGVTAELHAIAQMSTGNLLASEQLNFGYPNVRGFAESFATRDEGVVLSLQIAPRAFPLGFPQVLRIPKVRDVIAPFAFIDYGTGWNHQDIGGVSSYVRTLTFGPGFTYQLGRAINGRFDYGFVVQHFGVAAPGGQADMAVQIHT
jgi:hemolysin activation/secretion protein